MTAGEYHQGTLARSSSRCQSRLNAGRYQAGSCRAGTGVPVSIRLAAAVAPAPAEVGSSTELVEACRASERTFRLRDSPHENVGGGQLLSVRGVREHKRVQLMLLGGRRPLCGWLARAVSPWDRRCIGTKSGCSARVSAGYRDPRRRLRLGSLPAT